MSTRIFFISPWLQVMDIKAKIIDEEGLSRTITRLSHEILERNKGSQNLILIGMRTRGEFIAERIKNKISEIEKSEPQYGVIATISAQDLNNLKFP